MRAQAQRWTLRLLVVALLTSAPLSVSFPSTATTSPNCSAVAAKLTALGLTAHDRVSSDDVAYRMWSGTVASWDGVPLMVDLTVASGGVCNVPLISLNHGWGRDRTDYESDSAAGDGPALDHFNNVWFAARSFAVLTFDSRGFGRSCGKAASSNGAVSGLPSACTTNGRHYWASMDDMRYTVRDLQWLAGRFVDAGVANPNKIAVSGTSMGGALAWNAALLNDRVACGGTAYNTSNGIADPCTGHATGTTVPWRSPDGAAMHIAAAVPLDSWGLLTSALAPNGRTTDGLLGAPAPGNDRSPIGVPQRAWANALNSSAKNSGFLAPAGADPTADWATWLSALGSDDINSVTAAGGTTLGDTLAGAFAQMDDHKSPATDDVGFDAKVPILAIQGLTDSIFSSPQVELMRRKAVAYAASYPIAVSYGNVGHEPATNAADVVTAFNERASAFFDNVLRGVGDPPAYDTEVAPLRCTADVSGNPLSLVAAKSLGALQTGSLTLHAAKTATTRNTGGGSEANKLDPFYDGPYGCTHMSTQTDAGVASWTLTTPSTPAVVMGSPVVTVSGRTTGVDAELNVRLWQITSGTQTLIARGTYRVAGAPSGSNQSFPVQLSGTAWQLAPKSQLKVEVTGFDAPTFAPDSIASVTTIDAVDLRLPTTDLVAIGRGLDDSGQATQQQTFTVARFGDSSTVSHAGDYDATIDWGDGTASAGSIASNNGTLGVSGTHAYANAGDYAVTTTVRSTVSGVSAVENGTASISPPPQPPQQNNPPCRMPHVLHCL